MSRYRDNFFREKRPWSNYKDLVLDYYMKPYLAKVKRLGKPIAVVDMFAGRGDFESGEPGSPLILARRLEPLAASGYPVSLVCYETHEPFFEHLRQVLAPFSFARCERVDCFTKMDEVVSLASRNTLFLYIDPCDVTRLHFAKLAAVYEKLRSQSSVEVLIVLMAQAFLRQAAMTLKQQGALSESRTSEELLIRDCTDEDKAAWATVFRGSTNQPEQARTWEADLTAIAGGDYWRSIALDDSVDWQMKCSQLVDGYKQLLSNWFRVTESYPIRADTGADLPKYWLVFGSRYSPAIDLFNWAACSAAREQRQNYRQSESLFGELPKQPERSSDVTVDASVRCLSSKSTSWTWQELRWAVSGGANIGKFTESEVNSSIKRLLKAGILHGTTGDKVMETAVLHFSTR